MSDKIAPYAVTEKNTRGRNFNTPGHSYRSPFQRDRDRIIHSEAFRRLEGKTQVFTPGINDNYRNRLTHSIEVGQIAGSIARYLNSTSEPLGPAFRIDEALGTFSLEHPSPVVVDVAVSPGNILGGTIGDA